MGSRLDLQTVLEGICSRTYFQPKTNTTIDYSQGVIIYKRDWGKTQFADNFPHRFTLRYQVTYINPKANEAALTVVKAIAALPMCTYDRFFVVDDLNHDVFKLFF